MSSSLTVNGIGVPFETNLALLQGRLDFSLIKVEAPKEYQSFGQVLAISRR